MIRPLLFADRNDVDADLHADERVGGAEIGAVQRDGLARIARHRDADEVAGADDAVGGIELDPAGARQIDLHPGVGRAAADIAMGAVARDEDVSRHETRGDAEPPQRLDHEQRVVAAGAGFGLQRVERMLGAVLMPLAVGEGLADAVGHAAENIEGRGRPFRVEEIPRPRRQFAAGIAVLRRDELNEVGKFLVVVEKGIEIRRVVGGQRELLGAACARRWRWRRTTGFRRARRRSRSRRCCRTRRGSSAATSAAARSRDCRTARADRGRRAAAA